MSNIFVIAEAGVNHNGDIQLAKKLIDIAATAGADAVKFQTWNTDLIVTRDASQAAYQIINTGINESQYDMLKRLELSYSDFYDLKSYCEEKNIIFMSTAHDIPSANFLYDLQDTFKIGSGEITNLPYLRHLGTFNKKIILSSGMANFYEVNAAINALTSVGFLKENLTILQCTSEYPASAENVNLNAMITMKEHFGVKVGYSDHTEGIDIAIAAAALGACVIEKHFTIDKLLPGPDHKASLSPIELESMIKSIRNIQMALGSGIKEPSSREILNINTIRKSIVASCPIKKGDYFTSQNLGIKRPGSGISPMEWDNIIGKKSLYNFATDDLIIL